MRSNVFYVRYVFAELRRRKGRTILTALGLAVGVGLVITVAALSDGLDEAQSEVLEPLSGVGTDMSVSRPVIAEGEESEGGEEGGFQSGPGGPQLSEEEQKQLQKENGGARIGLRFDQANAGERFERTNFMTTDLSFPEEDANSVENLSGVAGTAPALTLNLLHVSGTVPEQTGGGQQTFGGPGGGPGGPESIDLEQSTISGVDPKSPDLGLVTPSQIADGEYFGNGKKAKREAIVSRRIEAKKEL